MLPSTNFLIFSKNTSRSSMYYSRSITEWVAIHISVPHEQIYMFIHALALLYYWFTYVFFLIGSRPLHKIKSFSHVAKAIRACTLLFQYLISTPRMSPSDYLQWHCFLALTFPFLPSSIFSFTLVLLRQTLIWTVPLLRLLLNAWIFSRLRHLIVIKLTAWTLSPAQPYLRWLTTSFLACSFLNIAISTSSPLKNLWMGEFRVLLLVL